MLSRTMDLLARALRVAAVAVAGLAFVPSAPAAAQEDEQPHYPLEHVELQRWSFAGWFGRFDQAQLQRGFQVYREVCSGCHSLDLVAFRHLGLEGGPHFGEDEVKALAAEYTVSDGPDEFGDMFDRAGQPFDYLPAPFPNDEAAASANGGKAPPDLSVIAKARAAPRGIQWFPIDLVTGYQEGGVDFLYALLTGYRDPPPDVEVADGNYYNVHFLGGPALAMPPPLDDGFVTYEDGTPETLDQYARDVSAFLMWAAEPHLVQRKRMGFQILVFVVVFAGLLYFTKQRIWAGTTH